MTGAEFAAAGYALALAYARLRPDAAAWLAAWQADDRAAADELMEWELEGHPFTDLSIKIGADPMTVADALAAMLALYAAPGTWTRNGIAQDAAGHSVPADSREAVAWSLEGALERVIGDWEGDEHRTKLLCGASEACGVDLAEFNDTVRRQEVVVSVLRAGWARCVAQLPQSPVQIRRHFPRAGPLQVVPAQPPTRTIQLKMAPGETMFFKNAVILASIALALPGCTYTANTTAAPARNVVTSFANKVPGKWAVLVEADRLN